MIPKEVPVGDEEDKPTEELPILGFVFSHSLKTRDTSYRDEFRNQAGQITWNRLKP